MREIFQLKFAGWAHHITITFQGCPVNKTVTARPNGEYLIKYRGVHLPECGHVERIRDLWFTLEIRRMIHQDYARVEHPFSYFQVLFYVTSYILVLNFRHGWPTLYIVIFLIDWKCCAFVSLVYNMHNKKKKQNYGTNTCWRPVMRLTPARMAETRTASTVRWSNLLHMMSLMTETAIGTSSDDNLKRLDTQ